MQIKVSEANHMTRLNLAFHSLKNPTLSDQPVVELFEVIKKIMIPDKEDDEMIAWCFQGICESQKDMNMQDNMVWIHKDYAGLNEEEK